jgi:penicillin-binding protein 2
MAPDKTPRADEPGALFETHRGRDPRVLLFHWLIALGLLVLAGGLAYQELIKTDLYHERERQQTQRRVLVPGPRGNILDRDGRLLVGSRARFAVVLYLDELQSEFHREAIRIRNNYRATGDKDLPSWGQLQLIARNSVVQRYLGQVDAILGTRHELDSADLRRHFERQLVLMPYPLIGDLEPEQFARLIEQLPVRSPLQLYTSSTRYYPYGAAAAHVLGYVGTDDNVDAEDFPGEDLTTIKMKGTVGRDGIEKQFDAQMQGQAGGTIFRVDPSGYKVNPPLEARLPLRGRDLTVSLDIDLQLAAEKALGDLTGALVALDPRTGEVLAMASEPGYNLNDFSPHLSAPVAADIEKRGAWLNLATAGLYPPGSTFKTIVTIAGLRRGTLDPTDTSVDCEGEVRIGNMMKGCENGHSRHGRLELVEAIAQSCDIYFYVHGIMIGPQAIADEARRFHLDQPTGIELPGESRRMIIPDPAWKRRTRDEVWTIGDTANTAIGQGDVQVTPLQMACLAASLARDETTTRPTLLHDPDRPVQHTEPTGLTPAQRRILLAGMEGCVDHGTAKTLTEVDELRIPGVLIAGKTGTAQYGAHLNVAWFICFAPAEKPEIAMAVAVKSDKPYEAFQGGAYAAPIAAEVLKVFFAKHHPAPPADTAAVSPGSPASG